MPLITSQQLKQLSVKQLPDVCEEIREKLISDVTASGGHLASNLGAVELSVALHFVFGEKDKIVWDVGHQCYTHKILTGRTDFTTLRKQGGLSGFPDFVEDPSDNFTVGHAGTAISQALGLAKARDINGEDYSVVAVVGDGSLTSGLTYEALNNVKDTRLIVVVNDNNMSISQSVGTSTLNLSKLRVGKYDKNKQKLKNGLCKIPLVGKPMYRFLRWCKRRAKLGYYRNSYFDNFDVKYVGIIDGNEVADLVYYLTKIRDNVTKPTVLHIITKKGKGYAPAEENPTLYHSVPQGGFASTIESSAVVSDNLVALADDDKRICAVCAAMSGAVGFDSFAEAYPDRFFDVGIAEEHAVTFAGGMARGGMRPFVGIYNTFLQRSYDEILHDVALQNLPVTFLIDRSGLVGEDGKTHQGTFGLSYLGNIPGLKIWCPFSYRQLARAIARSLDESGPVAICYPRYLGDYDVSFSERWATLKLGKSGVTVLAVGPRMVAEAMKLRTDVTVIAVTSVKPLDKMTLEGLSGDVFTLEENVMSGGFGEKVAACFASSKNVTVYSLAVPDCFVPHATVAEQLKMCGLTAEQIDEFIKTHHKLIN